MTVPVYHSLRMQSLVDIGFSSAGLYVFRQFDGMVRDLLLSLHSREIQRGLF